MEATHLHVTLAYGNWVPLDLDVFMRWNRWLVIVLHDHYIHSIRDVILKRKETIYLSFP